MALVPFIGAAGPVALAAEESAVAELFLLAKGAAQSVRANNTAQAVKHILQTVAPYVTRENAAAVKSVVTKVVDVFHKSASMAPAKAVAQQLAAVHHLRRTLGPPKATPRELRKAASHVEAIEFHDLARQLRSRRKAPSTVLIGVEKNPGPGRQMVASRAPAALSTRVVTQAPNIHMRNDGTSTRIRHRELLDPSVLGSTTYNVQSVIELNPGLEATFPWLAPQALQWEQYIAHHIAVIYIPIAPTDTQGTITISPSYDPSDPEPTTEQQLSNAVDTVEVTVWQRTKVPLRKAAMMTPGPKKFIRGAMVAGDIKTFDAGVLYVATNNCANTNPIGKLWIEYDFEFFVPQNSPNVGLAPSSVSAIVGPSTDVPLTTTVTQRMHFNDASVDFTFNPLNISQPGLPGIFFPPKGFYRVCVKAEVASTGASVAQEAVLYWSINTSPLAELCRVRHQTASTGGYVTVYGEALVACNGTDDDVQFFINSTGSGSLSYRYPSITFEVV